MQFDAWSETSQKEGKISKDEINSTFVHINLSEKSFLRNVYSRQLFFVKHSKVSG